jgi:hypothetical protein
MQVYAEAEAVQAIANDLIATYHPTLATAKFRFLFKEKASKKGGKVQPGSVKKLSDQMLFLIDANFLMEIPLETWNEMDATKRVALIDHLLERCVGEEDEDGGGDMKWSVREPDVNEFATILRRYGAWHDDLAAFVSVGQSIDLGYLTEVESSTETVQTTTN